MNTPESENVAPESSPAHWQRLADRLAWYGWLVLLRSIAAGFVGGVIVAVIWQSDESVGEMPGLQDLPMIISALCYLLVILLGVPSLLAAVWDFLRGRWATG